MSQRAAGHLVMAHMVRYFNFDEQQHMRGPFVNQSSTDFAVAANRDAMRRARCASHP